MNVYMFFPAASDSVKDITLNCPTSMSSGNFSLENPSISRDYSKQQILSAELERYHLLCKCLHKNVINEVIYNLLLLCDHYSFCYALVR